MDEISLENIPIQIDDVNENLDQDISDIEVESDGEISGSTTRKAKRQMSKLSPNLKGLMGEANLRFARGELELAKKMCFEVIRQSPDAIEPYLTLAQMYENHNMKKYKAFLMLACHLQPSNAEIWCRLADIELQDNQLKTAITYYSRAIRAEPHNIELHKKRMELVQQRDKETGKKGMLHCKLQLAKALPKSKHEQIISMCNEVAREYYQMQNYIRALETLRVPIKRLPDKVSQDLLNMMLELLLLSERYSECLDIFTQFCGFTFDIMVDENMAIIVNSYTMQDNIHADLKTKFIVCIIRLQCHHLVAPLIQDMLENEDIEVYGMFFFEIAEALMASSYFKEALQLLVPLVKSKNHSLAAVWLKHAECLVSCNMPNEAIDAYYTVISMAPNHVDVLYALGLLLIKQDRKEEALNVLSQDVSSGKLHVALLIEQMKLLKQIGDFKNYWIIEDRCSGQDVSDLEFKLEVTFEPSIEDEYQLFKDILMLAYKKREYVLFQKFAFMGLTSRRFVKYFSDIYVMACFACLYNKDFFHGYMISKDLLLRHVQNNEVWNIYSLMLHLVEDTRNCYRFIETSVAQRKLPQKNKELVLGNYFCAIGNYSECFSHFLKDYKTNTYAGFMIAMCMLQQYCQRHVNKNQKKSMLETVTYLFFNYAKVRSKHAKQEAFYNLARMYHQIGLFHLAEHYYKMVLKVKNAYLDQHPDILDLRQEAAYNLHLIYKNSKNYEAARKILWEHIVI
ncbi:hypothetical protein GWI33_019667 [Rhynchophorus ferrugineus]|uniref:General transcription factor 3C polypeptide 3 n=1 Tax=Rhynchophorus ferrugineus TaxID=354439 RepID=A0A834HR46_RHYFE|nr:hypothetical protein GWI33_019667 [Rhynchophorus ferrugineus]